MIKRITVTLLGLLTIFAFSNLALAGPAEDYMYLDCGTNVYPGSGTSTATFQLKYFITGTGTDKVAAFGYPVIITSDSGCIVGVDTTVAAAFAGSGVSAFAILSVGEDNTPVHHPAGSFHMVYGAVNFTGGVTGDANFAKITLTVNSCPCVITIDTLSTALLNPSFIDELANGYTPGWGGNPNGYPAGGTDCLIDCYQPTGPDVECGVDRETFAGGTFNHAVTATDPDAAAGICDDIVSSKFIFLDSLFVDMGLGDNTPPCGVASLTGALNSPNVAQTFDWNTTGCTDAATYYVVFTYTDECGASGADTCSYTIKTACAFVEIGEVTADPGATVDVPVYLTAFEEIGGFNFCIEFANADLTVLDARRAGLLADTWGTEYNGKFKWHYFLYRLNPSTIIHKYKICVIGIGKLYSSYPGICIPGDGVKRAIFTIRFVLAKNELFRCYDTHINFEWDAWTCLENTLTSCDGNKLFVSDNPAYYNVQECGLGEKNPIIPCVNFQDGRVIWRCPIDVDPIVIGDINVNGFPYEIGDAVLFASYFINGLSVFAGGDTGVAQIGATDINQDGYTLSVADLVYLIRIVVGDQAPLPGGGGLASTGSATATFNGRVVEMNSPEALGAVAFVFKGEGKVVPLVNGVDIKFNAAKGETRVLVSRKMEKGAQAIPDGKLFSINGDVQIVSVDAATYGAEPITVDVTGNIMPNNYSLAQNYPNPFNATTQISFALPVDGKVSLKIYNVAGQMVKSYDQNMTAGYKTITWDGTNTSGEVVASGVYFYKLDAEKFSKTMKMTLLK